MSISLVNMRTKLDEVLGNAVSGTTSANGADDYTTAIDDELAQYPDDYFKDRFLYMVVAAEERKVKKFLSPSGTVVVWAAFSAQVLASKAYKLRLFSIADEKIALNNALNDVFPYFYNPNYDTTLYGQNAYGEDPNEFNKYLYAVPTAFIEFPDQMWLFEAYTGTHTGGTADALTDSGASWTVNELKDLTIYNKTDGSSGTVTANTSTTVTATLSDSGEWDKDDEYIIQKPNKKPTAFHNYTVVEQARATQYQFYASIPENYLLGLVGKAYLTQFTTDALTTELTDAQAQVVCLKAAANLYEMKSAKANAEDAGRFEMEAAKFNRRFDEQKTIRGMPPLHKLRLDWSWLG